MGLINLSSLSNNFRASGSEIHWEFPHLHLEGQTKIALSSICIFAKKSPLNVIPISTSLINADTDNSEGIIACAKFSRQIYNFHAANYEFWNLDCSTPRDIVFTFPGINTADFLFANIVLVTQ